MRLLVVAVGGQERVERGGSKSGSPGAQDFGLKSDGVYYYFIFTSDYLLVIVINIITSLFSSAPISPRLTRPWPASALASRLLHSPRRARARA